MKMSGSIRRRGIRSRRSIVSRALNPLVASQYGTAHPGPEAHHSGPATFFPSSSPDTFCMAPEFIGLQRTFCSYLTRLERKFWPGVARSDFYE
jgi:hypothetical protein